MPDVGLRFILGDSGVECGEGSAMGEDVNCLSCDGARAGTQFVEASEEIERSGAKAGGFIVVIEGRTFLRECIRRSVQSAFSLPLVTYSTVSELESQPSYASAVLVVLSLIEASNEASVAALNALTERLPGVPVIVLASANDAELARTAIRHGAKGYIPLSMGFEIAIEAVRFVLAGGTYAPIDCLLAGRPDFEAFQHSPSAVFATARELAVIRAIQQGKSNKVIAYELNMCESTVKVHVRNVMKKLKAKNRTEVAIKAQISRIASSTSPV